MIPDSAALTPRAFAKPLEVALLGDLHGDFDAELDGPILARHSLRLCTGDLTPDRGRERFDVALRVASDLAACGVRTVLGNHDGPTCFTGRSFPKSYHRLEEILGDLHVGARLVEIPELGVSLVGARPLSCGGASVRFHPPGREGWTLELWADHLTGLLLAATQPTVIVLAHCGPTGLGAQRQDPYGCDFRAEEGDWGDADLRWALDRAASGGRRIACVAAGHMHLDLRGGGKRRAAVREGGVLHVNAAIVPRVGPLGRALTVLSLDGARSSARVEWHARDGTVTIVPLDAAPLAP